MFAALLHSRLVDGGAEQRLTESQYGFRSGYGTQDALFVLRRRIEAARAQRDGKLPALALDWKWAFDSVDPAAMIVGLRRFGLPEHALDVIATIYSGRCFEMKDCGVTSSRRPLGAGISQGCPLSPLLFVMTMTIVMEDAVANLPSGDQQFIKNHCLTALLYADDTLFLGAFPASVERFLAAVEVSGAAFGMQLHADKFQLLQVGSASPVRNTAGDIIEQKTHMLYLGASITDDGRIQSELSRRIGAASADLRHWHECGGSHRSADAENCKSLMRQFAANLLMDSPPRV